MGLFGTKEDKVKRQKEKQDALLARYELQNIDPKYIDAINNIELGLSGTGMIGFSSFLSRNAEDTLKIAYLRTLMEQNWIMIRLMNDINQKLDK